MLPPPGPPVDAAKAAKRALAGKRVLYGGILLLLGIVITVATHDSAERNGGGTYIIAYGPMVVGGVRMLQGLLGLMV
jgi:hypothetical protein